MEFYKANIKWICKDLLNIYNEAIDVGTLGREINSGIIKLIPKEGDKALLKNWRPITLLNVSYKILAKIMSRRLEIVLPKFVCPTQTGFVKGRYILENLITSWEALNWAKHTNQNVAMFLLDFEKAYDRIEWGFISMMLDAFGFPSFFCDIVKMLLRDAHAQIDINGSLSAPFPLGRSIRQGCPLAPALFVIAFEALFYILRDNTLSPAVKGITLPDNKELINCQFVDDTTLFHEVFEDNFVAMTHKLNFFCKISGAKLSRSKSICLGWNNHPPDWFSKFEFQWGGPSNIVRYLGIPFSVDPSLKDMWSWVKDKIHNKLNKWHNRSLSFVGRVQKAWNHVRQFIKNKDFFDDKTLHGERSIWWNLKLGNKPLALTQGCSAKCWANLGIKQLIDIFENDRLIHWDELKSKFNLSDSHKRTYNMIVRASRSIPNVCHVDSNSYQKIKWPGGIIISGLKSKNIYSIINDNNDIIKHINDTWYVNLDVHSWNKIFDNLWKSSIDPKIKFFKWLLILNKLPIRNYFSETNMCSICRTPEMGRHVFFECSFAKEVWLMFGISIPASFNILEVITGFIFNIKKDVNMFWDILSANILWQIWKCRNEERFQNVPRLLTESFRSLTYFKKISQIQITMMVNKAKFKRLLRDGHATFFTNEVKNGYFWRLYLDNIRNFNLTFDRICKEIKRNPQCTTGEMLYMRKQIQDQKNLVWMEGALGWTAWVDSFEDVLH
ncbi:uncharacterized protein LOC131856693 [Cryptomeria japonica]|uniref:uncharacterized protein LOC131856693 n=1 Tax=Cryptomeria japonica TaxID=3369 RepID=UPI0027DA055D|nr:uncharacterized protein LOC131856693 [Cryptomeria japonica]